jgi:hypothetical protein
MAEYLGGSPYSVNTIQKNMKMIYEGEYDGLTYYQATRRKVVLGGLLAALGAGTLVADFLYGGPIRNALYPQNTTRGQEMESLIESLTSSSSEVTSTQSQTYTYQGRLFFDRGTSTFGTAGNGIQDDTEDEPGEQNAKVLFLDENSNPVGTVSTDSSGDFSIDLPAGNYTMYPVISNPNRTYGYMCQSVDEFRAISEGYPITVGENNPKASIGLMQGWLAHPPRDIDLNRGGYYDRDPRRGFTLAWNGATDESEDQNPGTHFQAEWGDYVPAFAPGRVTLVLPNLPENWVFIGRILDDGTTHYEMAYAHNDEVLVEVGQKVSRYQPVAKAGVKGCGGCGGQPIIHFQFSKVNDNVDNDHSVLFLDPYQPVFPYNMTGSGGAWANNFNGTDYHWQSLSLDQNPNWENRWIVYNQTHYGPPYS